MSQIAFAHGEIKAAQGVTYVMDDEIISHNGGSLKGAVSTIQTGMNGKADKSYVDTELGKKVDKVDGKGLSTNDYTTAEKNKLAGVATGATKVTVDSSLSGSSTNAIQNKAVTDALTLKADKSYTDTELAKKASTQSMTAALATKADSSTVSALQSAVSTKAEKAYVDTQLATKASTAAMNEALGTKADNTTVSSLAGRVSTAEGNIATQTARIDNIAALPSGSTSGDAELLDIRVGADSKTYTSAGAAVRAQITDVKSDLSELNKFQAINDTNTKTLADICTLINGGLNGLETGTSKYRVNTEYLIHIPYNLTMSVESGFNVGYVTKDDNTSQGWTWSEWKSGTFTVTPRDCKFQIKRLNEDTSETADIGVFGSKVKIVTPNDTDHKNIIEIENKLVSDVDLINEIIENPIIAHTEVTHTSGWTKEIILDGIDINANESYAVIVDSDTALPSCYLHLYNSSGIEISNRALSGKRHDKWVINSASSYSECTLRIASASNVTVKVSWGMNIDGNAIDSLNESVETIETNTYAIENVRKLVDASLYLRKNKYCKYANKPYTVFDNLTINSATSYTLEANLDEIPNAPVYIKVLDSDGNAFKTITMSNVKTISERFSSTSIRENASVTAQYSGYDGITVDIILRETFEKNIIDNIVYKGEYNVATCIRPKDDRRAMMTIIDDDGKSEFYDIYKAILESGTTVTCAIDPVNWVGTDGFMTWEQIEELQNLGCEFVVHGAYPWLFPKSSMDEGYPSGTALRAYIAEAQKKLKEHNLSGWNIGVYPQSNHNHDTRTVMKDYFTAVFAGTPPEGESCVNVPPITTFRIYRFSGLGHYDESLPEASLQDFKDAIDETVTKRGWLVILNHSQYGWDTAKKQKLAEVILYAKTKGVSIVNCKRGLELYRNVLELGDFVNKQDNGDLSCHVIGSDGTEYKYPPVLNGKKFVFNDDGTVSWTNVN